MKKSTKHKAKQFTLPGMTHPKMGRPLSGNKICQLWMNEWYAEVLKECARFHGTTPGQLVQTWIARDLLDNQGILPGQ